MLCTISVLYMSSRKLILSGVSWLSDHMSDAYRMLSADCYTDMVDGVCKLTAVSCIGTANVKCVQATW